MPKIRPITDFTNVNEISAAVHAVNEPIFMTKNGYGDFVVMSMETYEKITEEQRLDDAIAEAEAEYQADGILLDAADKLAELRRKYIG